MRICEKIERLNPKLNAFVHVDSERAFAAKLALPKLLSSAGKPLGPLHGVPISIKSSIDVAGMRCEAGTRLRAGIRRTTRMRRWSRACASAGAIVLGVTNTPELLMAWETDNLLLRPHQQPVGSRPHAGRIERRRSGGYRRGHVGRRRRQRRRRIDSRPRPLQRHLRTQAHARAHSLRPATFHHRAGRSR